jgi:predicted ATP-dependent endonuclease of OLD family
MKIRSLVVKNFRGIKTLEWTPEDDSIICLIGHGDSTKSTILKAIEYVLHPKWNLQLKDTDFYRCNPSENPIEIRIIIGQLPSNEFDSDPFFAKTRSFWNKDTKKLSDSSESTTCESVVSIILKVDESLEPSWYTTNESGEESIKQEKRKLFNMVRLDINHERNFKWGYNTILSRLLEKNGDKEIKSILAKVGRESRTNFEESSIPIEFRECSEIISEEAKLWGTGHNTLKPYLDVFSADSLCLNDDYNIPIYMLGAGSKKLMLIAIEKYLISNGDAPENHIILIDEVENGLEPHRLIHVIFELREITKTSKSQILLSTHSPIALKEIAGDGAYRVINNEGKITLIRLENAENHNIRAKPEGYFLKKIIICEGKTEIGILREFKKQWITEYASPPEHYGTYFVLGEGSNMSNCAKIFKDDGYDVCIYRDSDRDDITISEDIKDFKYDTGLNIEQAICKDAPESLIQDIIQFCVKSEDPKLNTVTQKESHDSTDKNNLAKFLHDNDAFRRIDTGEELGKIILKHLVEMGEEGTFIKTINNIKNWIYSQP